MTAKSDFVSLFQDVQTQVASISPDPQLADFNFMITSLRTIENLNEKLEKVDSGQITAASPSRGDQQTWVDLRSMGLVNPGEHKLNEFGKAALEYFGKESDAFKREHFVISSIRNKLYGIPESIYSAYQRKLGNLTTYLNTIPQTTNKGFELLLDEEKVFFTECLNTYPSALVRYFGLTPSAQDALDSLHEHGLDALFSSTAASERGYYNLAHKFANVCRAFERRTNFIKSATLSEYEEAVQKSPDGRIPFGISDKFAKVLTDEMLVSLLKQSDRVDLSISARDIVQRTFGDDPLPLPSDDDIKAATAKIREKLILDDAVIGRIVRNLVAGKHVLLAGPIGSGKTHLAQMISRIVWKNSDGGYHSEIATATSEWTTQDVIGGIYPKVDANGNISYLVQRGCVTDSVWHNWLKVGPDLYRRKFERDGSQYKGVWLVIDEFNRANIDGAFGELFTALEYKALRYPTSEQNRRFEEVRIPKDYRVIATLNTFDKHFLFKMSDALKRRFAYVELLPPTRARAEEEKYYIVLRALEDLPFTPPLKAKIVLDDAKREISRSQSDTAFLALLDSAHDMLCFIRQSKNLGTGIPISIFRVVFVGNSMNSNIEGSLDDGLVSNVIPQLENLPVPTLQGIRAFCCGDIVDLLRSRKADETEFPSYQRELGKLLTFLGQSGIPDRLERFRRGQTQENEWPNYNPWSGRTRPSLPSFRAALDDLINESETV